MAAGSTAKAVAKASLRMHSQDVGKQIEGLEEKDAQKSLGGRFL